MTTDGRVRARGPVRRQPEPTRGTREEVVAWLLEGDVAIQYQVHRDLLGRERPDLQRRIAREGWGAQYLAARNADGSWGLGLYQPKWTCTHYTLLDLASFGLSPDTPGIREEIERCAQEELGSDGGINPAGSVAQSDVCINGMFLTYACHFGVPEERLATVVDFVLAQTMDDGGFNCRRNRSGARHSSVHSTICVLEGAWAYARRGYRYRAEELAQAVASSRAFLLQHRLFKSDRTGAVIHPNLLRFVHPSRWRYHVLRCLDGFAGADVPWDERMADAMDVVVAKRRPDGRWNGAAAHPGKVHVVLERAGTPSRWITLMALRMLDRYGTFGARAA